VPHIFAAGDVIGPPAFGRGPAWSRPASRWCHAFDLLDKETPPHLLPCRHLRPSREASMGRQDRAGSCRKPASDYVVSDAPTTATNPRRGRIIGDESGFLKPAVPQGPTCACSASTQIGEHATELVHVGLVAMHCDANADLFSRVCFNSIRRSAICTSYGAVRRDAAGDPGDERP
jgi:NAD(P) transhydrogenase